jgi:hypothetical protein
MNYFDYKPHLFPLLSKERMLSIAKQEWFYKKVSSLIKRGRIELVRLEWY